MSRSIEALTVARMPPGNPGLVPRSLPDPERSGWYGTGAAPLAGRTLRSDGSHIAQDPEHGGRVPDDNPDQSTNEEAHQFSCSATK